MKTITDIAKSIDQNMPLKHVGIRPGEKLHEQMIGFEDAPIPTSMKITLKYYLNNYK